MRRVAVIRCRAVTRHKPEIEFTKSQNILKKRAYCCIGRVNERRLMTKVRRGSRWAFLF
jgi:hypothetical protein